MNTNTDKTGFWTLLGFGVCILLASLGVGSCGALLEGHVKINYDNKQVEKLKQNENER